MNEAMSINEDVIGDHGLFFHVQNIYKYPNPITLLPTERRCQVTAGVAKQANTSSVLLKWVRWGQATA